MGGRNKGTTWRSERPVVVRLIASCSFSSAHRFLGSKSGKIWHLSVQRWRRQEKPEMSCVGCQSFPRISIASRQHEEKEKARGHQRTPLDPWPAPMQKDCPGKPSPHAEMNSCLQDLPRPCVIQGPSSRARSSGNLCSHESKSNNPGKITCFSPW